MTVNERAPEGERSLSAVRDRMSMSLEEAMATQRAVRRLLPDEVDEAIVLRCIELAQRAPTGSNGQNWQFVVVRDLEVKRRLAHQYRQAWRLYGGLGRMVAGRDPSMRRILDAVQFQVDHFEEVPVVVVACLRGITHLVPLSAVQTIHYGSIYPSVQNLLLAARSVGLGASLITLPLWNLWKVRRILGLPWNVHPVCMVPMGWPRGRYGPTTRTPVGEVTHLDRYGNRVWRDHER
jgi:nitroreductase